MTHEILVPFDFSPESERALALAADWQRRGLATSVDVVHIVNPFPPAAWPAPTPLPPIDDDQVAALHTALNEAVARHGARASTEVLLAMNAGEAIVARAREQHAELVVMGTHGRTGLRRAVLGSVAEYVVRHADCPVVTLRAPAEARAAAAG